MQTEKTLVSQLTEALKSNLGADFSVVTSNASASVEGLSPTRTPDILVAPKSGGRPVLLEVRGIGKEQDLPLSTAHITQVLLNANASTNPKIVIVTASRVRPLLQSELDSQGVTVLKAGDFQLLLESVEKVIRSAALNELP